MRDQRQSATSAMTLIEIAISLGIVAIAVLSILALLPAALRTQEINRYKIYAAAKAVDLIERFHKNTVDFNEIPRATTVMPNSVTAIGNNSSPTNKHLIHDFDLVNYTGSAITERRVFSQANAPDLENVINTPDSGNLPMPPEIARRLDSPDDAIRKLIDGGGTLWYADPTAEAFSAKRARMSGTSRSVTSDMSKLVWGVITPPQQNAIPYHPFIEPQRRLYPCPPTEYSNDGDIRHALPGYGVQPPVSLYINCLAFERIPGPGDYLADGLLGRPKTWLNLSDRKAWVTFDTSRSDGFYLSNISLRQSRRGGDGLMANNWMWFAYSEAREAFEQSPRLDVGANKPGSSPWLLGYYEWERMRRFHYERLCVQTRKISHGDFNVDPATFINNAPEALVYRVAAPGVTAGWYYLDGPKATYTIPDATGNGKGMAPSPPIGLGISGLRGSDIIDEDQETWRGDNGIRSIGGVNQATINHVGDRDLQIRLGMPGLQRRIMYRTAAMMVWARVKPLFPPAENPSDFYDHQKPMRFNPVDITSLPARKLSGVTSVEGTVWAPTGGNTLVTSESVPDANVADLALNLPDADNPLLSILPVPPAEKIHPAQIYALNAIAHAARIVTGYRPPFIDDKGTINGSDDSLVPAPIKDDMDTADTMDDLWRSSPDLTVYPHRAYDERCWDIINWWEKDLLMPMVAENDPRKPLWLEFCHQLNQADANGLKGYESPRRDSKRWLCWLANPFLEEKDSKGGLYYQDGTLTQPLLTGTVTEETDVEATSTLGFLKRAFLTSTGAPRDQPVLQTIPIQSTSQHSFIDRVQRKCGIGYFRKAQDGLSMKNPPPYADRGAYDWAGRRTDKLRYHWYCKNKTEMDWQGSRPPVPPIPATYVTYALMDRVKCHGKIYECVRAGRADFDIKYIANNPSGLPLSSGPNGTGTNIADFEVRWSYVRPSSGINLYRCVIDSAAGGGSALPGDVIPAGMAPKALSPNDPASDTRMARIALENCLRWTYAYTASRPYDSIVPKPLNIQLSAHQPLYCFDPFKAASGAPQIPNRSYGTGPTNFWDFFQICGHPQGFVQAKRHLRPWGPWSVWLDYEYHQYVQPNGSYDQTVSNAIVVPEAQNVAPPSPPSILYQARLNPTNSVVNATEDADNYVGSCGFHYPSAKFSPPLGPYLSSPNVIMPKLLGKAMGKKSDDPANIAEDTIMIDTDARTPLNELRPYTSATTAAVYQHSYFGFWGNNNGPNNPLNPYLRKEAFSQMTVKATADTPRDQTVLGRSFEPSHRARVIAFWAVDWQQYEDAESAQSAPMDASRVPPILTSMFHPRIGRYTAAGPGLPEVINMQSRNSHWYGSLFGWEGGEFTGALNDGFASIIGNPERALCWMTPRRDATVYRPPNRNKTSDVTLNGIVHRVDNDYPGVVYLKDVSAGYNVEHRMYPPQALGLFGADRNGNGVFDRGPVPATQRMRAVEVGRVVFYDPVAWTTLGR